MNIFNLDSQYDSDSNYARIVSHTQNHQIVYKDKTGCTCAQKLRGCGDIQAYLRSGHILSRKVQEKS